MGWGLYHSGVELCATQPPTLALTPTPTPTLALIPTLTLSLIRTPTPTLTRCASAEHEGTAACNSAVLGAPQLAGLPADRLRRSLQPPGRAMLPCTRDEPPRRPGLHMDVGGCGAAVSLRPQSTQSAESPTLRRSARRHGVHLRPPRGPRVGRGVARAVLLGAGPPGGALLRRRARPAAARPHAARTVGDEPAGGGLAPEIARAVLALLRVRCSPCNSPQPPCNPPQPPCNPPQPPCNPVHPGCNPVHPGYNPTHPGTTCSIVTVTTGANVLRRHSASARRALLIYRHMY